MIVTGHQPNFLPGLSVMSKVAAADAVIWMDEMQYERHGFVNRNRFEGESFMTIPVATEDTFAPINRVRIADPTGRAREKVARTIEARLGRFGPDFGFIVRQPFALLVGLNVALLDWMRSGHGIGEEAVWYFQSHLAAGRYANTSEGLAAMVAEVGGTVWLSGPSGRNYLDETPFAERGIEVRYYEHVGPNPCALELLRAKDLQDANV